MKKQILILLTILSTLNTFSQTYKEITVYKKDNTKTKISGRFIYQNSLIERIQIKDNNFLFDINEISKILVNDEIFIPRKFGNGKYLFQQLVEGNLSLYKDKEMYYLENNAFGLKILPQKENNYSKTLFKPGTVSLFINKCKSAVDYLYDEGISLSVTNLRKIVTIYNSCLIQENVQIADERIKESTRIKDKVKFGLSLGTMIVNTDLSPFQNFSKENTTGVSVGVKLFFNPNPEKTGFDFNFSLDYFLGGNKKYISGDFTLENNVKFINALVGVNYSIDSYNEKFKPYFGLSGGLILNSNSSIEYYNNDVNNFIINEYTTSPEFVYHLNVGTLLFLFDEKFDVTLSYFPSTEIFISSKESTSTEKLTYNSSSLNLRITYIF